MLALAAIMHLTRMREGIISRSAENSLVNKILCTVFWIVSRTRHKTVSWTGRHRGAQDGVVGLWHFQRWCACLAYMFGLRPLFEPITTDCKAGRIGGSATAIGLA